MSSTAKATKKDSPIHPSSRVKTHTYGDKPGTPSTMKTALSGQIILSHPLLNKGTAFTKEERDAFRLCSLLPYQVNTLDEQTARLKEQHDELKKPIIKNAFMQNIHDQNETLFYSFIIRNLKEVLPIVYTPTEGDYIASYSHVFHRPRGVYLNYPEKDMLEHVMLEASVQCSINPEDVDLIVVTDSEEILGIGDQGVGGIAISVAKLVLYTAMAGVNPGRVLPVVLDVGTNNQKLLDDPLYLGWRHERLRGQEYDKFVDHFVEIVQKHFPNAFLHWEDFGVDNARRLLKKYQPQMATFNDDVQGTGAITLACVMAGLKLTGGKVEDQRIVIFGSGSAGIGIADQLRSYMEHETGLSKEEAAKRFWCLDRPGLLCDKVKSDEYAFSEQQLLYVRRGESCWDDISGIPQLLDVVKKIKPTILVGCSTVPGAFTEEVVTTMAEHCESPMIFPLSNPTKLHEATPDHILHWTKGKAIVTTGSPFDPVEVNGKTYEVAECNNSFAFPGIGLGCIVSRAKHCTDPMIVAAANAISEYSPAAETKDISRSLLPDIEDARKVSMLVATAVAKKALESDEARIKPDTADVESLVRDFMWEPKYSRYELIE